MDRNLDKLKEVLWQQFEIAAKKANSYEDFIEASQHTPTSFAIQNRQALAQLAHGIIAIEKEQREAKAPAGFGFDKK